jgi:leucyl-tRNA synthetase
MTGSLVEEGLEEKWQVRWRDEGVFAVPPPVAGVRDTNVQVSCPFTSGAAHMGHVRSYSIADAVARWRRANGDAVLFTIGFDAFGLPAELGAAAVDMPPARWVEEAAARMREQFDQLGISFDWRRSFMSSDPAVYRWSQWLFLVLLEAGMIDRREGEVDWCPSCRTVLAKSQVLDGTCWRCHGETGKVERMQWYLAPGAYHDENAERLGSLGGWNELALSSQRSLLGQVDGYFPISRQRAWGTPIPIVHCPRCGVVRVPLQQLPVLVGGSSACECPDCGSPAERESDTLDCHFDATWQQYPQLVPAAERETTMFDHPEMSRWLPISLYVQGADIGGFILDERSVAKALRDLEHLPELEDGEPYAGVLMHGMVKLAGTKMSKHLGNVVDPRELVGEHGADAVRVGVLQAAAPARDVTWSPELVTGAKRFLERLAEFALPRLRRCAPVPDPIRIDRVTRRRRQLGRRCDVALAKIGSYMEGLELHRAVRATTDLLSRIEDFGNEPEGKTSTAPDADDMAEATALLLLVQLLAPFAPHLAEELWEAAGREPFVAGVPWPATV